MFYIGLVPLWVGIEVVQDHLTSTLCAMCHPDSPTRLGCERVLSLNFWAVHLASDRSLLYIYLFSFLLTTCIFLGWKYCTSWLDVLYFLIVQKKRQHQVICNCYTYYICINKYMCVCTMMTSLTPNCFFYCVYCACLKSGVRGNRLQLTPYPCLFELWTGITGQQCSTLPKQLWSLSDGVTGSDTAFLSTEMKCLWMTL